eukprot:109719_1
MSSVEKQQSLYDRSHHRQFKKGDRVKLQDGREATVKFEGSVLFSSGYFVGIALDEQTGKHDGRINGRRYFHCAKGHGLFVRPISIKNKIKSSRNNQWRVKSNDYWGNNRCNNHHNRNQNPIHRNHNHNRYYSNKHPVPNTHNVVTVNPQPLANKVNAPMTMQHTPLLRTHAIPTPKYTNMAPLHPSAALISAFPLTHQNINLYNSIPNHLYNILNTRSTPNSLYSSQIPYPASTVSCLSYQGGLNGLRIINSNRVTATTPPIANHKQMHMPSIQAEEDIHEDTIDEDMNDDADAETNSKEDKLQTECNPSDKERLKKHIFRWSNFEDADDIKDDNDYFALKLERRRSYPFVERELHLGKLLRIRSRVNDKLRQEKRSLKTKIDEVQNTSTELWSKNEELKERNKQNRHRLQCLKKDIKHILDAQSPTQVSKDLNHVFDNYLKDLDDEDELLQFVERSPSLTIKTQELKDNGSIISCPLDNMNHDKKEKALSQLSEDSLPSIKFKNLNEKIKNDRKTGAKLEKRRLRMWNNPKYDIDENSTIATYNNDEDKDNLSECDTLDHKNNHQQYIIDFIHKFGSYERCAQYLQTLSPSPSTDSSVSVSGNYKKLPFESIPELQDGI